VAAPRVPIRGLRSGPLQLDTDAERHLVRVLRLAEGDAFTAFDPELGLEAAGTVVAVKKGATLARIDLVRAIPERPRIFWVHGLPKGDKPDAIARDATELGVTAVVFAICERSVPKLNVERAKRWQKISDEAARQCGRAKSAQIRIERSFADALVFATVNAGDESARFCFHPEASRRFEVAAAVGPLVFAAGPEGGFTGDEIATAEEEHFVVCSLGDLVLRTETVPAAVLGAVLLKG
jgi:16S rRNA (uracil1498-N3)-methyltransferase